jgi:multiple sugar transport system substrate-binding protein
MPEVQLSIMIHTPATAGLLRAVLDEFETLSAIRVRLITLQWEEGMAELNRVARYQHGPDISEIGSTWVNDLVAMNALRPFTHNELAQIGRPEDFLPASWSTGKMPGDDSQWALPWLAETYLIHYRCDLLARAGIAEDEALSSHAAIANTAARLHAAGVDVPVEPLFGLDSYGTLHSLASWVWTAGGDFCAPDGRRVLFAQPATLKAIVEYFRLLEHLSPDARRLVLERKDSLFARGEAGLTFGTLMFYANYYSAPPLVQENWRVAPFPGAHFMGGSNLVVWKHAKNERAVLELARFLTSPPIQARCALPLAALPPRLAALATPRITEDPVLSVFADALRGGRSYPSIPLWGLIEDRLVNILLAVGQAVLSGEAPDLDATIRKHLEPLERRLNLTLAQ